jgi:hypothetical protein
MIPGLIFPRPARIAEAPAGAISFVSSSNSLATLTYVEDDIIVAIAWDDSGPAPPTTSTGFTNITGASSGSAIALRLAWRRALTSNDSGSVGGWGSGVFFRYASYRGCVASGTPIGDFDTNNNGNSGTCTIPAKSLAAATSWVVGGYVIDLTATQPEPAGLTTRESNFSVGSRSMRLCDTNGPVSSFSSIAVTQTSTARGLGYSIELLAA